ncbi:serine protease Do [Kerstersia gyiorum]|uniref:Probable periplasmic serine endoprotease DegP-like n=3 Tax=Kerstersia gyiorum TaxID=206506 RepID=A0A4Q7MZY3_9BURK|nr:serine protease Do [Kerstersia gyiorum]
MEQKAIMRSDSFMTGLFRSAAFKAVTVALAACMSLGAQQAVAQTRTLDGLPDFTPIVEKTEGSVVNIRTTATVQARGGMPGFGGEDPYEMFRWFFGPDMVPPGAGRRPGPGAGAAPAEPRTVPRGIGSGFIVSDDGYILTNNHVVEGATDIFVTFTDGREVKARLIGADARTDVAVIKVDDQKDLQPLAIGDSNKLRKGQWVLAIGSPFGLESTVTSGIVSAIGRETGDYLPFIQTDVAVNPGNSGGPLINLDGEAVGINSQIVTRSGGFIGISLAIPIDEAMRVADQLKSNGRVVRGRIGVQISEVSKDVADAIGLPNAQGALVSMVEEKGPAEAAGVQPGDVIVRFNDHEIKRWSDLPRLVGDTKPDTKAPLEVWRKGKKMTLNVRIGEIPTEEGAAVAQAPASANANALGLAVAPLDAEARAALKVAGGVVVRRAEGVAAAAGIREGDVLLTLNTQDISAPDQFNKLVSELKPGSRVALLVRRDDISLWVTLELPAK